MLESVLFWAQIVVGLAVFAGAFLTLSHAIDEHTPLSRRALFVAVMVGGVWYAAEPVILGVPTSTKPGLLFAGFVAWVMLRWRHELCDKAGLQ